MRRSLRVFDQMVSAGSPAGSCVLAELAGLSDSFEITVFSSRCEIPESLGVSVVKIPLPRSPIVLRYILFQILAPIYSLLHRKTGSQLGRLVQTTQGQYVGADVAYAHFCHRAYLAGPWKNSTATGLRRLARWTNHQFNAFFERRAFLAARAVVVPSMGLARELAAVYPSVRDRLVTLPNPVDLPRFAPAVGFDRIAFRKELGFNEDNTVFVFFALGDFSRKGLGLILPALANLRGAARARARVLVVGGQAGEIEEFRREGKGLDVSAQVQFVGLQRDVTPYLWASDLLVFPSAYEIFSLSILQAAAAALPVVVSEGLYGAEEFVVDGVNGWVVPRTIAGVEGALNQALANSQRLADMGRAAQESVQKYSQQAFVERWRAVYAKLLPADGEAAT